MDLLAVMKNRRSVRSYRDKPVAEEILKDLVDCARLAPSGYNRQDWIFVVITDREIKNQIAAAAYYGRFIRDAGACIAVYCGQGSETPLEDACAATENLITAAGAYGLGTCWVNSYRQEHAESINKILCSPSDMELMTLLAVGYPREQPKAPGKKTLDAVLRWNGFNSLD